MTTDTTAPTAASNPNDAAQDSSRQGPGRLIRLARERTRMGISEMAALTKLATATLEALERDDFTILREPVYVRGYYRKCAKALAISEQELLSAYEKVVAPRAPQAPTKLLLGGSATGSSLKKTRRRSGSPWLMWLIGFAVLVAVGAWFLREDPNGRHVGLAEAPLAAKPAAETHAAPADSAKPLSTNELATTRRLPPLPAPNPPRRRHRRRPSLRFLPRVRHSRRWLPNCPLRRRPPLRRRRRRPAP